MIAVGSGGFFGKGIGNASQSGAGFLPEAHTDFIFALLSEVFGFAGALVLLAFFALLIFGTIRIAHQSDSLFLQLACIDVYKRQYLSLCVDMQVLQKSAVHIGGSVYDKNGAEISGVFYPQKESYPPVFLVTGDLE